MTAELWLRKPCQHGRLLNHNWTEAPNTPKSKVHICPGGSEERLDPERAVEVIAATLWRLEYGQRSREDVGGDEWYSYTLPWSRAILDALGATDE
jgi:hypothetical protein